MIQRYEFEYENICVWLKNACFYCGIIAQLKYNTHICSAL